MKYVLASASPRRVEMLSKLGFAFETMPSQAEENLTEDISGLSPGERVEYLSFLKGADIAKTLLQKKEEEDYLIISSDTVVSSSGLILEKPKDREDAAGMIRLIEGKTHEVYTAVSLFFLPKTLIKEEALLTEERGEEFFVSKMKEWMSKKDLPVKIFTEMTAVSVYPMTKEEIEAYISTEEPYDKAGAYAIQGGFSKFIQGIRGDYGTVKGLPLGRLYQELKAFLQDRKTNLGGKNV